MMFTEALALKIVKGEKTQTSRVLSDNPRSPWYRNRAAGERYPVGKVFTVNPGRGVYRVAECEVTARFRRPTGSVIANDYRAEGFATPLIFAAVWGKLHPGFDPAEVVDVVRFKLHGVECLFCGRKGCPDCFGTGVDVWPEAQQLIRKLEAEG